jgi:UDP-galactopyranose mutase
MMEDDGFGGEYKLKPLTTPGFKGLLKKQIICMSSTHWHFLWQRPQQIMSRLSREYNVLFVDPPYPVTAAELSRGKGGGVDITGRLNHVSGSLKVLSPHQLQEAETSGAGPSGRNALAHPVRDQIRQALQQLKWNQPSLLWIYNPRAVTLAGQLDETGLVYDCVDSFTSFSWADPRTGQWEQELLGKANVVITSAAKLYERHRNCGKPLYLVSNAADFEHFSKINGNGGVEPADLRGIKHPRLGFIGAIYEWLDFELIERLAVDNPQWNLVLIGPRQHGLGLPEAPHNLHWLGPRDYKALPWYLNHLDIMIIPFLLNETTEHANPIKLWEYLAAGKPVVTTELPEVPRISGVTWISENYQKFQENCANALDTVREPTRRSEVTMRARSVARCNSWEERCRQIGSILRENFAHLNLPNFSKGSVRDENCHYGRPTGNGGIRNPYRYLGK